MVRYSAVIQNLKKRSFLLLFTVLLMNTSCSLTNKNMSNNNPIGLTVGSLIKYETESKISLNYGNHSSLKEVYQIYYSDIKSLPKKDRALFFFIVDNNMNVTGGSDLFDYYDLVYSCCQQEYISLVTQNIDNPYFNSDILKNKLGVIQMTGDRIQQSTAAYATSESDYLQDLKNFYLSENE